MAETHFLPSVRVERWALALFAVLGSTGCGDVFARPIDEGPAGPDDSSVAATDGGALEATAADAPGAAETNTACPATVTLPVVGASLCAGDLAHKFRFAACACDAFNISGRLATDAFDSAGDAGANATVASIAANGSVAASANIMNLGGSVWAGGIGGQGTPAVALNGGGTIVHDIRSGGDVTVGGNFVVAGNVFASGNVSLDEPDASLSIGGALHLSDGGTVSPAVSAQGGIVYDSTPTPAPCDCSHPIDVAAIVLATRTNNDNAAIGLATTALHNPSGTLHLPCGHYYVSDITGGRVQIVIDGRVGLFVDGPLYVDMALQIDVAPDAELDLFVAGDVTIGNMASLGNLNAPARVRLYSGGQNLQLGSSTNIGANVYAPYATVTLSSDLTMWGAFFAKRFDFSGDFTIHYDTSVLGAAASGCAPSGGTCTTCEDCAGATPACIGGACVACSKDSDCCAPLTCSSGRCVQPTL